MLRSILAASATALLLGCSVEHGPPAESHTESRSVDAGSVEMVRVELRMGAGELRVSGGAGKLMEGEFRSSTNTRPEIRYDTTGFRGRLNIQSASRKTFGPDQSDKWDVRLGGDVPIDLFVRLGAGEGELKPAGLALRSIEVELGAGELKLDLREKWERDFDVRVRGGVGEATVYLPRDVGVIAEARGGIGDIRVTGMKKQGSRWVNDLYEKSKTNIRVDVRGGVGQINLLAE